MFALFLVNSLDARLKLVAQRWKFTGLIQKMATESYNVEKNLSLRENMSWKTYFYIVTLMFYQFTDYYIIISHYNKWGMVGRPIFGSNILKVVLSIPSYLYTSYRGSTKAWQKSGILIDQHINGSNRLTISINFLMNWSVF